jgi:hypothetical protein
MTDDPDRSDTERPRDKEALRAMILAGLDFPLTGAADAAYFDQLRRRLGEVTERTRRKSVGSND